MVAPLVAAGVCCGAAIAAMNGTDDDEDEIDCNIDENVETQSGLVNTDDREIESPSPNEKDRKKKIANLDYEQENISRHSVNFSSAFKDEQFSSYSKHRNPTYIASLPQRKNSRFADSFLTMPAQSTEENCLDEQEIQSMNEKAMEEKSKFERLLSIHDSQIIGSKEEIEIDYDDECSIYDDDKTMTVGNQTSGYVDGNFINGKVRDIIPLHSCTVVKFTFDSKYLALGLENGRGVSIYETKSFSIIHTIPLKDTVSSIDWMNVAERQSFPKTEHLLAIGTYDGNVTVHSVPSSLTMNKSIGLCCETYVRSEVRCIKFLPCVDDSDKPKYNYLLVGETNGTVTCFSFLNPFEEILRNGENCSDVAKITTSFLCKHDSAVLSLDICRKNGLILMASGTKEGKMSVHSLEINVEKLILIDHLVDIHRHGPIYSLRFLWDKSFLFVGGYDKTVAMIDTDLWKSTRYLDVDGTVNTIEFDSLHKFLAVGTRGKSLIIYDTSTFYPIKILKTPEWVSSVSWGSKSLKNKIAVRGEHNAVSIIEMDHVRKAPINFEIKREGIYSSLSWSYDGRFIAKVNENKVIVSDSSKGFCCVGMIKQKEAIKCTRFCHAEGRRDMIVTVGDSGFVSICRIRYSVGRVHLEKLSTFFLEKHLRCVAWSSDGSFFAVGGKGERLHIISSSSLKSLREPIEIPNGRVNSIDFVQGNESISEYGLDDLGMAIGTADGLVIVFSNSFEPRLQANRPRSVRCVKYHTTLPILAIGDGKNTITLVDLVQGKKYAEFDIEGRVNAIDFSPLGDFIATASDSGHFYIHDFETLKVVQEFLMPDEIALSVAFSGNNGLYLALDSSQRDTTLVRLGPLLSTDLLPIKENENILELPKWVVNQTIFMSWEGPTLIQRCMMIGNQASIQQAALILKHYPDAIYSFDRSSNDTCFDTALYLKKPTILKLILKPIVDGSLEAQQNGKVSLLMTAMPQIGSNVLKELVRNHPPEFTVEILKMMTFIKVPFTEAKFCSLTDENECGSSSFTDPWEDLCKPMKKMVGFWSKDEFGVPERKEGVVRIPAVLPLPGLGSLAFISVLIREMPPNVFDNDAMGLVLRVLWNSEVKLFFLWDFSAFVVYYICWIIFMDFSATSTYDDHQKTNNSMLAYVLLVFNSCFVVTESRQLAFSGYKSYFQSKWNLNDILACVLVYVYTIHVLVIGSDGGSVVLAAFATFSLTVKLLGYLRGFNNTGWLISMLVQNFLDVRGFLIVLFVILVGFTCIFRVLIGPCSDLAVDCEVDYFSNIWISFLSTIELTMLASYERSVFSGSHDQLVAIVFFLLAILVVFVVSLNALITILGDSFSRVQENATANRRKELAELIVDYLSLLPSRLRRRIERNTIYFHALLEADVHGDLLINKDDWQGGLNALKKDLADLQQSNFDYTLREIGSLRSEMNSDISALRHELTTTLAKISVDIKRMSKIQRDGGITISNRQVAKAVRVVKGFGRTFDPLRIGEPKKDDKFLWNS